MKFGVRKRIGRGQGFEGRWGAFSFWHLAVGELGVVGN